MLAKFRASHGKFSSAGDRTVNECVREIFASGNPLVILSEVKNLLEWRGTRCFASAQHDGFAEQVDEVHGLLG